MPKIYWGARILFYSLECIGMGTVSWKKHMKFRFGYFKVYTCKPVMHPVHSVNFQVWGWGKRGSWIFGTIYFYRLKVCFCFKIYINITTQRTTSMMPKSLPCTFNGINSFNCNHMQKRIVCIWTLLNTTSPLFSLELTLRANVHISWSEGVLCVLLEMRKWEWGSGSHRGVVGGDVNQDLRRAPAAHVSVAVPHAANQVGLYPGEAKTKDTLWP